MRRSFPVQCLAGALALWAPAAVAQEQTEADFDYDALIEDLPIES